MKIRNIMLFLALLAGAMTVSGKTYLVCVGLNKYDNGERPLPCSRGDVKAMADFFDGLKDTEVFMLLDNNATRSHILKVLQRQFAKAKPEDEIIFAYSGHGFDGGVSCYDTRNVVFCYEIQDIMAKSKAGRKVMFVNSCHSGSFSKKYKQKYDYKKSKADVMLYLSSRDNESSWESSEMKQSFFFAGLLAGLKGEADANHDGRIVARELFNYVNSYVINVTGGMQHPQMFGKFSDNMVVATTR